VSIGELKCCWLRQFNRALLWSFGQNMKRAWPVVHVPAIDLTAPEFKQRKEDVQMKLLFSKSVRRPILAVLIGGMAFAASAAQAQTISENLTADLGGFIPLFDNTIPARLRRLMHHSASVVSQR
jgi:hypothetical protein